MNGLIGSSHEWLETRDRESKVYADLQWAVTWPEVQRPPPLRGRLPSQVAA